MPATSQRDQGSASLRGVRRAQHRFAGDARGEKGIYPVAFVIGCVTCRDIARTTSTSGALWRDQQRRIALR